MEDTPMSHTSARAWASSPPDWGQILAFGVLPVLVVFTFFQRWFVQGAASSAVKG